MSEKAASNADAIAGDGAYQTSLPLPLPATSVPPAAASDRSALTSWNAAELGDLSDWNSSPAHGIQLCAQSRDGLERQTTTHEIQRALTDWQKQREGRGRSNRFQKAQQGVRGLELPAPRSMRSLFPGAWLLDCMLLLVCCCCCCCTDTAAGRRGWGASSARPASLRHSLMPLLTATRPQHQLQPLQPLLRRCSSPPAWARHRR